MAESGGAAQPEAGRLRWWQGYAGSTVQSVGTAVGVAVAAVLVSGFVLGAPGLERAALAAVLGSVTVLVDALFVQAVRSDRSGWSQTGPGVLVTLVLTVGLDPLVLWGGVAGLGALGLSVELTGFGTVLTAALLAGEVQAWLASLAFLPGAALRGDLRPAGPQMLLLRRLLALGGLALSAAVLGGVWQSGEGGGGWRQWLTFGLLAGLLSMRLRPPVPGLGNRSVGLAVRLVLAVPATALKLWAVSWLSSWTDHPLHVTGLPSFVLAGLITAGVMLPGTVVELRVRGAADAAR